ncbi:MAG: TENA/THI-4 protein [Acidobacteria bacterium]|nr:MAG: TENA/THI-4 protein [Acidobacteriota bacterium]
MESAHFFEELDARIAKYDLLDHPYYKAWAAGELSHDDLREYACQYYHHVAAFPTYLAQLAVRLDDGDLRQAVLANMADEKGLVAGERPHAELWLDFAEGMGASRDLLGHQPVAGISDLIAFFHDVASNGAPEEALAAFYAYESQVPRLATEKLRGLRDKYAASDKACAYFDLHTAADIYHAQVWRQQLEKRVEANPTASEKALSAAEATAQTLWRALDGIESSRLVSAA